MMIPSRGLQISVVSVISSTKPTCRASVLLEPIKKFQWALLARLGFNISRL